MNLKHERNLGGGAHLRGRMRQLLELARATRIDGMPASEDPVVRDRLADLECQVRCAETMTQRQLSAVARGEDADVALPLLVNKLYGSDVTERIVQLGFDLLESDGLIAPAKSSWGDLQTGTGDADWVDQYLFSLAGRIAAGSSNIQRNVIGERGLGLPRDLRTPDMNR